MNITQKFSTALATAAVFATALVPAVHAEVTVQGNGNRSDNRVDVRNNCDSSVTQSNAVVVTNNVTAHANTGDNSANANTGGGNVTVDTGDARSVSNVTVTGGDNEATAPDCCTCLADANGDVTIRNNGNRSDTTVDLRNRITQSVTQGSALVLDNTATLRSNTGRNKANRNTGNGNKRVKTGDATSRSNVVVGGGSNTVTP